MTRTYLLIAALPSSPSPNERTSSYPRKIIDANCTNSYVLNSGVTEPNLTKFFMRFTEMFADYSAEIKIKLRSSNPFQNANVTYEDRPKIAGAWWQKFLVLTT